VPETPEGPEGPVTKDASSTQPGDTAATWHRLDSGTEVAGPTKPFPLSRGAPERRLTIVNHYNRRAAVTSRESLTPTGTVRVAFQVTDNDEFDFDPGCFIGIHTTIDGVGPRRTPYCLASVARADRTFRLLVRVVPDGPISCHLGALTVGETIAFRGPLGRSMMPPSADQELILLATGVGIGPLLALVETLAAETPRQAIRLFWGLRQIQDVCLVGELDALVATHGQFNYEISLSEPPSGWTGLQGRITTSVPPLLATLGGKRYYLVGNGAMIEQMISALSDLGVDRTDIYAEAFFNARYRPSPAEIEAVRNCFVAHDLFSPHNDDDYAMLRLERPLNRRR